MVGRSVETRDRVREGGRIAYRVLRGGVVLHGGAEHPEDLRLDLCRGRGVDEERVQGLPHSQFLEVCE